MLKLIISRKFVVDGAGQALDAAALERTSSDSL